MTTWSQLVATGELDSYREVAPSQLCHQEDAALIEQHICSECGGQLRYRPYTSRALDSYRPFGLCSRGHYLEF